MSDANRVNIGYAAEVTFGTALVSPAINDLRFTGETLQQDTDSKVSQEIRSDRQHTDLIRTDVNAAGDLEFEFSYGAFDTWLQYALQSAGWSTVVTQTPVTLTAAAAGNTLTRSAGSFTPGGNDIVVGQWIKVSGLSTNGAAFFAKVTAVSSTVLTISGKILVNEGPQAGCTVVMGAQIVNGTSLFSMYLERTYSDLTNDLAAFSGMCIDGMELNVAAGEIDKGKFSLMGKRETSIASTIRGSTVAAATNTIMNAIDDAVVLLENGVALTACTTGIKIGNNLRARKVIGVLGADSVGVGSIDVSGPFEQYYTQTVSKALIDKYLNFTQTSLAFILGRAAANAYVIDLPAVKFSKGPRQAKGINTDVMAELEYTAFRHATEGITIRIARFP